MKDRLISTIRAHRRYLIYGFGREGQSSLRFLKKHHPEGFFGILDQNLTGLPSEFAGDPSIAIVPEGTLRDLADDWDRILVSPGISLYREENRGVAPDQIISQTSLFLDHFRDRTIGVTGTKGKSSTVSLLEGCFRHAGRKALLLGNIGKPALDLLEEELPEDVIFLYELSSYQLSLIRSAPAISIVLNVHQDHLDYHGSYANYIDDKFRIFRYQLPGDHAIYSTAYEELNQRIKKLAGEIPDAPTRFLDLRTLEEDPEVRILQRIAGGKGLSLHRESLLAVLAVCRLSGLPFSALEAALGDFQSLRHRLEDLGWHGKVRFFNDSISTIPAATLHALEILGRVDTLVCGGYDRGIDYNAFCDGLILSSLRSIVTTGPAGEKIAGLLEERGYPGSGKNLQFRESFDDAVQKAVELTPEDGICLLSPAASSYNEFRNFEERGDRFRSLVTGDPEKEPS